MLKLEIDSAKLDKTFQEIPIDLQRELRDGFDHIRKSFFKKFKTERLQGPPGIKGRRGGILTRFRSRLIVDPDNITLKIWTKSKAAMAHEYGTTIGGGGKKLAVPLPTALTPTGALKKEFKRKKGQTLEDIADDLIPIKSDGKVLLVRFRGQGKNKKMIPLFVLRNNIMIKPRLGFSSTWAAHRTRQIQILNNAISKAFKTGTS